LGTHAAQLPPRETRRWKPIRHPEQRLFPPFRPLLALDMCASADSTLPSESGKQRTHPEQRDAVARGVAEPVPLPVRACGFEQLGADQLLDQGAAALDPDSAVELAGDGLERSFGQGEAVGLCVAGGSGTEQVLDDVTAEADVWVGQLASLLRC
jgi:hypothetical protein